MKRWLIKLLGIGIITVVCGCVSLPYEVVKHAHPYQIFLVGKDYKEVREVAISVLQDNQFALGEPTPFADGDPVLKGTVGEVVLVSKQDIPDEMWGVKWHQVRYGGFWSSTPGTYFSITRSTHKVNPLSLERQLGHSTEMLAPSEEVKRIVSLVKARLDQK